MPRKSDAESLHRPFVLVLLIGALVLSFFVLRAFFNPIMFAVLLAMLAFPFHRRLLPLVGGRNTLAALLVVFGVCVVIIVPVFLFLFLLFLQGAEFARDLVSWVRSGELEALFAGPALGGVEERLSTWLAGVDVDLSSFNVRERLLGFAQTATQYFVRNSVQIFGNLVDIVSKFFILVFLLFYLVRDGSHMVQSLRDFLPMRSIQKEAIFEKIRDVTRAVVFGTFAIALIQGVLGGIGLAIVGIPGLIWGTVLGFSSMIPIIGTGLVSIPAVIYLAVTGQYWQTVFFAIWAVLLVGGVDNYLRPFLMQGRAAMSPFYIFLATIGGLSFFGLPGLVYGPLVISFTAVMIYVYRVEYGHAAKR
ncbi:MAG: AI-2E family transporter [Spirochaetaceae bacterium]